MADTWSPDPVGPVPVRPGAVGPARKARRITQPKARRLVDLMLDIKQCTDCTPELRRALDEARAAIGPWYEREERRR